jgi:hypothetical protein
VCENLSYSLVQFWFIEVLLVALLALFWAFVVFPID